MANGFSFKNAKTGFKGMGKGFSFENSKTGFKGVVQKKTTKKPVKKIKWD